PDQFDLVALCDIDPAKASQVARDLNVRDVVHDFRDLLTRTDVDVIDLCTPPYQHFDQLQSGLKAGKHMICEKPLLGSLSEVDRLSDLVAESEKQVMPIFQYRFGHGLQKLKHLVDRKLTGEAFVFNVDVAWWRSEEYYRDKPWRGKRSTELGGALLSQAIHAVDMIFYILGPAKTVSAFTRTRVSPIDVEDCVAIAVELADGSLGTISVTLGSITQISRHRFTFRRLTAESNTEPYSNSREPWSISAVDKASEAAITEALNDFKPQFEGYEGQFSRFFTALQDGGELPVTIEDARRSLEFIGAVYHSNESGERVELPLGRQHPKYYGL
ncbi:MAG TPA: Gfo/Idh/MocA family oxidoreductase, partial [Chthoniobacterales bacterium]